MGGVEILIVLLLVGGIALLVVPRLKQRRGMGGGGANMAPGTLLITGVSAGAADANGKQNVTIAGVINGPTVNEHETYAQLIMGVGQAPTTGQLMPVVYSTKNPDKWGFAPPESPGPPPQAEPKTEIY